VTRAREHGDDASIRQRFVLTTASCAVLEHEKRNSPALRKYYAVTDFVEPNVNALWHACGRLFRTPRARFCAECGRRVVPQAS
jgi:hypothetical protein